MPPALLLVDDEREATEALQMVLALRGFTVRTAASGREAVAAVQAEAPDLVLL
ncbi:MAG: response regulator, partial [Candidatus Omnitrophica bacterium]|nr:response regulator [Candidatus Omnitrophota bacterium]